MLDRVYLGQHVWLTTEFGDVISGIIVEINTDVVNIVLDTYGMVRTFVKDCYPTKESLLLAL